jgi:protein ImuB
MVDHRDAIAIDITDTRHLFGGDQACIDRAVDILGDVGHRCRVIVVDGDRAGASAAARALAVQTDRHRIVPLGGLAAALASIPVQIMRCSLRLEDGLRAVGVRTLGELARLSAASVACRYGAEGLTLLQMARGDRVPDPCDSLEPSGREVFDGPSVRAQLSAPAVRAEAVQLTLDRLLERLCEALQTTESAAVRIQLRLVLEAAPDTLLSIRLGRPGRDPATVGPLIRRRLEDLQVSAPVVEVGLDVLESCPYHGRQHGLLDRSEALEPLPELVARLLDTLGEDALFRAQTADVHRPEAAWKQLPFESSQPGELFDRHTPEPIDRLPRPTLLLPEPRPLRVQLDAADDVAGLEVEGRWVRVDASVGPERLSGEWWTLDPFERDYHRVALADGRVGWIFLDRETGDWWLHGWFA